MVLTRLDGTGLSNFIEEYDKLTPISQFILNEVIKDMINKTNKYELICTGEFTEEQLNELRSQNQVYCLYSKVDNYNETRAVIYKNCRSK